MPSLQIYVYFTGRKFGRKLVVSFVTDGRKSPWLTRLSRDGAHCREPHFETSRQAPLKSVSIHSLTGNFPSASIELRHGF